MTIRLALLSALLLCAAFARADNWPAWRGPGGDGISRERGLPIKWDEQSGIFWKKPLPGSGASTPVIWGDDLFVTTQDEDRLLLLRLNKQTGEIIWTRQVGQAETPRGAGRPSRGGQVFHQLHNNASPSPAVNAKRVVAHFGNGDLTVYDFAGKQLWRRNLQDEHGKYTPWWGHANSPVIVGNLVINVCMQDALENLGGPPAASYLVAYDLDTGKPVWQTLRTTGSVSEASDSYTTPVLRRNGRALELVVMGANQLDAYDPQTGKQLWLVKGLDGGRTITGPTVSDDFVFCSSGFRRGLFAVRPRGGGEQPAESVVWTHTRSVPDSSCPVVWGDLLFTVTDNGIAQCFDKKAGELFWSERLGGEFKASPIAAEGRVYFLHMNGKCTVVAAERTFRVLSVNTVDDELVSSPAISDGRIYLRGKNALYAISGEK